MEQKLDAEQEVTREDIRPLIAANEEVATNEARTATRTINEEVSRKLTGYGEHGMQLFNEENAKARDRLAVISKMDTPYQAGLMNKNPDTMTFDTPLAKLAYNAGQLDFLAEQTMRNTERSVGPPVTVEEITKRLTEEGTNAETARVLANDLYTVARTPQMASPAVRDRIRSNPVARQIEYELQEQVITFADQSTDSMVEGSLDLGYTVNDSVGSPYDLLNESERGAVLAYKSGDSYKINARLNAGVEPEGRYRTVRDNLDSALERLPVYHGTVYRNLGFDDFGGKEAMDAFLTMHQVGNFVLYRAYTSTSKISDGHPIDGRYIVNIEIESKTGRELAGIGNNAEQEVLFARDSLFIPTEITVGSDGNPLIRMKEAEGNVSRVHKGTDGRHRGRTGSVEQGVHSESATSEVQHLSKVQSGNDNMQSVSGWDSSRHHTGSQSLRGVSREVATETEGSEHGSSKANQRDAESDARAISEDGSGSRVPGGNGKTNGTTQETVQLSSDTRRGQAQRKIADSATEYGLAVEFVAVENWPKEHEKHQAYIRDKIYIREDFEVEHAERFVPHEAAHAMRRSKFQPYLDFISNTFDKIDHRSNDGQDILQMAADHRGIDLFSMDESDMLILSDEIAAMVSAEAVSDLDTEKLAFLQSAFRDYDAYKTELKAIHQQFKSHRKSSDSGTHYSLKDSTAQKNTTAESGGDVSVAKKNFEAAPVNRELYNLVAKVKSGKFQQNDSVGLGVVADEIAQKILEETGVNPTGYRIVIEARQIEHILKDHGETGGTDRSMADVNDIAKMEFALGNPDSIVNAGRTNAYFNMVNGYNRTAKTVLYERLVGKKSYYIVQAVPDTKAKTLYIVSAFIGEPGYLGQKKEAPRLTNAKRPGATSETVAMGTSKDSIPQKRDLVKENRLVNDDGVQRDTATAERVKNERWDATRVGDPDKTPMSVSKIVERIRYGFGINITSRYICRIKNTVE